VAAGSLNLAGCALGCALFMELADYSRYVASDLLGEVCRSRKSFPAMTVFHSILRIAKWREPHLRGAADNHGGTPRLLVPRVRQFARSRRFEIFSVCKLGITES
jgi:hypothetical protein